MRFGSLHHREKPRHAEAGEPVPDRLAAHAEIPGADHGVGAADQIVHRQQPDPAFAHRHPAVGGVVAVAGGRAVRIPLSYDLAVENVHFGEGETDAPISVEGHGTASVRLPLHVNWSRLGDVGRGALQTGSVNYGISGELTVATGFGRRRIPYSKAGRFSVLQ